MAIGKKPRGISRRDFMKTAGTVTLAAGMGVNIVLPGKIHANKKKLKIAQWIHTDPDYEKWFSDYCNEWGKKNETEVILERYSH